MIEFMNTQFNNVYPEIAYGGFSRVDGTIEFFSRLQALAKEARVIVDVGCGRGRHLEDSSQYRKSIADLRGAGHYVIGIDVDSAAQGNPFLDEFREIGPNFIWPIESGTADLVFADHVLEHVSNPQAFLSELDRVLSPNGLFAARTPNKWGYPAIFARLVPNKAHAKVVSYVQSDRKAEDVFPTVYQMNTRSFLRNALQKHGLTCCIYGIQSEPSYFQFSHLLFRVMAWLHPLVPPPFRSTLLVFARRSRDSIC